MRFDNSFVVPMPPEAAWPLLLDVPTIAPCLPGAEITEVLGVRRYRGCTTIKVGPMLLVFEGEAEIVEIDDKAMTARVVAKGNDNKGRGNASANVIFALHPDPGGAKVTVVTDLVLVGAVAQYARGAGLLKDIAEQLISQFADNLAQAINIADADSADRHANKPISAIGLVGGAIKRAVKRRFGGNAA